MNNSIIREFIDVFMDQRMYWIKDFARYVYEQKLEGSVVTLIK